MYNSTRYFQITPDILLEYNYTTSYVMYEQGGDVSDRLIDLYGEDVFTVLQNDNDSGRYFFVNDTTNNGIYANKDNFVTPTSASKSKFVKYYNKLNNGSYKTYNDSNIKPFKENIINHENDFDVAFDKIRLHFTSRNFFNDYDSLIFQANIIKNDKTKISLLSFIMTRLDNVKLNPDPLLINQKLYTSYVDIKIVSTDVLLNYKGGDYDILTDILGSDERLMKNTPIMFDTFGVNSTIDNRGFDIYKCEKISSINIPCVDSYDNVSVNISEANDGDYFVIKPVVSNGELFSDFISNIDEEPENYVILHELTLTEFYLDLHNNLKSEITHKEHYVVNATIDEDGDMVINRYGLNNEFLYRPICKFGSKCIRFVIEDVLRIVNTKDNTTIVKKARKEYNKPYKYGKYMNKIYTSENPVKINVYNRRRNLNDSDDDAIKLSTSSSSIKVDETIKTNKITVSAFCETTNIRVSIME